jgi:hypothetical protein
MRILATSGLATALVVAASLSFSQPSPTSKAPETEGDAASKALDAKRAACRQDGTAKGLRATALTDHIQTCMLEARQACLNKAIEQNIRGPQRSEFIEKCLAL